jgi:hypothetical protein
MASLIRFNIKSRVSRALLFKDKRHFNSQLPVHVFVIPTSLSPSPFPPGSFLALLDVVLPLNPKL